RGGHIEIQVRRVGTAYDQWVSPERFRALIGEKVILAFLWEVEEHRIALLRAWRGNHYGDDSQNLGDEAHPGALRIAA
ncbi:hypothetical protein KW797_01550, partial [Candidatus Parcubacteria bacterium]|nr:hypothetical protein [Candidatus Parcubacteria bacterium]